jgi:hypothetical protein
VVLAAEVGAAADTGNEPRVSEGIGAVVGVEAGDAAILDVSEEYTAPAAIMGRAADADDLLPGGRGHVLSIEEAEPGR